MCVTMNEEGPRGIPGDHPRDGGGTSTRSCKDAFVMCLQTPFQMDAFRCLGNGFIGIDATYNLMQYQNFLLFTIVARDQWGCGT
jgi:hypothetical protein